MKRELCWWAFLFSFSIFNLNHLNTAHMKEENGNRVAPLRPFSSDVKCPPDTYVIAYNISKTKLHV